MTVHLSPEAADECVAACGHFVEALGDALDAELISNQESSAHAFDTARQLGTVYALFVGEDLRSILSGYIDQASAMSMLFAAAGGLIEAQDEAVAAALGKAAQEPVGLQSLGLMGSLGGISALIDAAEGKSALGGYAQVGPEEVSTAPLARMVAGAQALDPGQFMQVSDRLGPLAETLRSAAANLRDGLGGVLGSQWQGEFASQAGASVGPFTQSVTELATVLEQVADKAVNAEDGFSVTRKEISSQAAMLELERFNTAGGGSGPRAKAGPLSLVSEDSLAAAEAAAEEQARAIVNTIYSPAVMRANLADLDIPTPYRVVNPSTLSGPQGLDLVSVWNVDGVIRPAGAVVPGAEAIAAAGGGGATGYGPTDEGNRTTTTSPPPAATNAATDQALLASRAGAPDAGGTVAAAAGQAGGGAGAGVVNAATTAAGAPFAPATTSGQQSGSGAGAGGIRGIRGGAAGRDRDRGFGPAAGLVGGGGATAAGAGASRMGGAGTLAGLGNAAGPGGGGPAAGAPGGGSANAGAAGSGAGAFSSSSTGGAQAGRPGAMPMGGMMGAAGTGHNSDRRGHTPAGYLTNATNTSAIIGDPVKVAPAVLGRRPPVDESEVDATKDVAAPDLGRVIGRDYTGNGARRR